MDLKNPAPVPPEPRIGSRPLCMHRYADRFTCVIFKFHPFLMQAQTLLLYLNGRH